MADEKSTYELALMLRERAVCGRRSVLLPETARQIAEALLNPPKPTPAPQQPQHGVDMFADGSTVYQLGKTGEILSIAAWASNSLVARVACDELARRYPTDRFEQRRRARVERSG